MVEIPDDVAAKTADAARTMAANLLAERQTSRADFLDNVADLLDCLTDVQELADVRVANARAERDEARASLGGMVEWLAEVIIDTRDALRVGGCTEHVLTAEQAGALEAATRILARERNADPSRYDLAIRERDDARAAIAAVRALCEQRIAEHADYVRRIQDGTLITLDRFIGPAQVNVADVLAAMDVRHDPSATTEGGAS